MHRVIFYSLYADPESFVSGDPTLTTFLYRLFSVAEGREDPNTTISGSLSANYRKAIEMAFRWCADDGQTLNVGLVAL